MSSAMPGEIQVIDSHTGGEPTRVVLSGGPQLRARTAADAVLELQRHHDYFRRAVIDEPRGSDVMIGALLLPASTQTVAGVVFFNNAGYLGMCGHGAIGVAVTLLHEGLVSPGRHQLETPAGTVQLTIHNEHEVSVDNVASYRYMQDIALPVPDIGVVHGDIAYGGNWFFLVNDHSQTIDLNNVATLSRYAARVRAALDASELRGADDAVIDHIELCGPPSDQRKADSRNFVLCPGNAYDRSPCGTGTSAKLACLIADNKLPEDGVWRQESITGSIFIATARLHDGLVYPSIRGSAYLTARSTLLFDSADPFISGMHAQPGNDDAS